MQVAKVSIDSVEPWDKNPRGIKTKDFDRLKKQILKLGIYKPLVAYRENGKYIVLGGNMRIRALKELGIKEVDISVVEAKTEAKKIEFALSDNDRAGYYEEDKLAELVYPEIKNLDLGEFKIDLGEALDLKQVIERFGPDIDDGADDVPEIDDTPAVTKSGDLFTLGKHRLMCGDSTKAEDVARLMRGDKAGAVVTDPPYGIGFDYSSHDDCRDKWFGLMDKCVPIMRGSAPFVIMPCCGIDRMGWWYERHTPDWLICWYKGSPGHCSHVGFNDWEALLVWGKPPSQMHDYFQTECGFKDADGHPCPKPIAWAAWLVERAAVDGAIVLDPFLGSGTTLIAAEKTGRICYGMEIDRKYCDVIIKRYADYVGVTEESIRATRENPNG